MSLLLRPLSGRVANFHGLRGQTACLWVFLSWKWLVLLLSKYKQLRLGAREVRPRRASTFARGPPPPPICIRSTNLA